MRVEHVFHGHDVKSGLLIRALWKGEKGCCLQCPNSIFYLRWFVCTVVEKHRESFMAREKEAHTRSQFVDIIMTSLFFSWFFFVTDCFFFERTMSSTKPDDTAESTANDLQALVDADTPELLRVLQEMKAKAALVAEQIRPVVERAEKKRLATSEGVSFLELKYRESPTHTHTHAHTHYHVFPTPQSFCCSTA